MAQVLQKLSKDEIKAYQEAFRTYDKDGDGRISYKELRDFIKSMGGKTSDAELQSIMSKADKDGSGFIDFKEFIVLQSGQEQTETTQQTTPHVSQELRKAFKEFDKDGNGKISVKELKEAMKKLGNKISEKEAKKMMKDVDENGDGNIDYEEFVKMMS